MKVHYQDDRLLQLKPRLGGLLLLLGLVFALGAPLFVWFLGQRTALLCDRISDGRVRCQLSRTILSIPVRDQPIEALTGAYVAESEDSEGDLTYRVVLTANDRSIPLTEHTSSGYARKAETVREIQQFLSDPSVPSLEVRDSGWAGWVAAGAFLVSGLGMVLGGIQASRTLWTFDRDYNVVVKYRQGLFGAKSWEYRLSDISDVVVASSRDSDGDRTYRVELWTSQGQQIPMTGWYSSGYRGKESTADTIRQFLGRS